MNKLCNTKPNLSKELFELYRYFEDDTSQKLFLKRLEYSITQNTDLIRDIWSLSTPIIKTSVEKFKKYYEQNIFSTDRFRRKQLVIYGAGIFGKIFCSAFPEQTKNAIFCDRNYEKLKTVMGHPVISPEILKSEYKDSNVIISITYAMKEITEFLNENGIVILDCLKDQLLTYDTSEQYFDPVLKIGKRKNEVFVDCGAYDGSTSVRFAELTDNKHEFIYLFEADPSNYKLTTQTIQDAQIKRTQSLPIGLWSRKEKSMFKTGLFEGSHIDDEAAYAKGGDDIKTIQVQLDKLDNVLRDENVTFIKMDIEGAELQALKGASDIIQRQRPNLAISIYHKPEDIVEIPIYIKSLVPEYKLYLRHYALTMGDTVLYATL